jgi:hypothetical protein
MGPMYPRRRRKLSYIDHFAHWLAWRNAQDVNDVVVKLERGVSVNRRRQENSWEAWVALA